MMKPNEVLTGSICSVAGPRKARSSEGPLSDFSVLGPGKERSPVLHLEDSLDSLPAHHFHCILVGQVVTPLDRVKGMVFPAVSDRGRCVPKGSIDSSLSGYGMGSQRMDL